MTFISFLSSEGIISGVQATKKTLLMSQKKKKNVDIFCLKNLLNMETFGGFWFDFVTCVND